MFCPAFLDFQGLTPQNPFVAAVGYADFSNVILVINGMIPARWNVASVFFVVVADRSIAEHALSFCT